LSAQLGFSNHRTCEWYHNENTYNELVVDTVGLAPAGHDVGVVVSENDDLVNTLLNELVLVLLEAGDVAGTACRSEGTAV
jgi:hypothetical protein